jgi:TctA family transporter
MIKKINVYTLIKILFILVALALIVIIRAGYYQMDTLDRLEESTPVVYFTPFAFGYIAIRLLSFVALFAAGFNLKAAMEKRLHLNKTRFILSIILLLLSLINYYNLFFSQGWIGPESLSLGSLPYFMATKYLTLVTGALAGYLCCSSFKTE